MNKITTKLLALTAGLIVSMGAMAQTITTGTYSERTISADFLTSTWNYVRVVATQTNTPQTLTEDNGVMYQAGGSSKQKVKSEGLSSAEVSSIYLSVPVGATGKISMECYGTSDGRYFQLFVNGTEGTIDQRLWSKESETRTEDGKKGPRSYTFTSDDITTIDGNTYLHFKDNNTEMKVSTLTITLTSGSYDPSYGATPTIKSFTVAGVAATIDQEAKTITAELPYGTDLTALEPAIILGGSATTITPTGAQNFTSPVTYTVGDGVETNNVEYTVTLTAATTASTDTELTNVTVAGKAIAFSASNEATIVLSKTIYLSVIAVTFDIPATATADVVSGNTHDFVTPLAITVTAQDGSTTATYTINVINGTKDILYITKATANDNFLAQLQAKGYYAETRANGAEPLASYDAYDLIVLHESLTESDAGSGELAAIKTLNKPILNTKAYFYGDGRWGWGTANNGNDQVSIALNSAKYLNVAEHPIFADVTIAEGNINIYNTATTKNIQPVGSFTEGFEGYNLATVPAGCAIHELPAGARGEGITAKYLLVSLLNGKFNDLTADALKLLDNACNYLMSENVWTPTLAPSTALKDAKIAGISYANGMLRNANNVSLRVYNAAGKMLIATDKNVDMSGFAAGVYVVRTQEGAMKIVK